MPQGAIVVDGAKMGKERFGWLVKIIAIIAEVSTLEPAKHQHLPVYSSGSVSAPEDITANQNLIIVNTRGFERMVLNKARNDAQRIIQMTSYILRVN